MRSESLSTEMTMLLIRFTWLEKERVSTMALGTRELKLLKAVNLKPPQLYYNLTGEAMLVDAMLKDRQLD